MSTSVLPSSTVPIIRTEPAQVRLSRNIRIRNPSELNSSVCLQPESPDLPVLRWQEEPRSYLRLEPTMITSTPPIVSTRAMKAKEKGCYMWVHLLSTICTEWAQNSMVLSPGTQIGARVMTTANKTNEVTSILQALAGTDHQHASNPVEKQPKTIHRCILQRANRSKTSSNRIECHVCEASYPSYDKYFTHLIDTTCAKQKEALELAGPQKSPDLPSSTVGLAKKPLKPRKLRSVPQPLVLPGRKSVSSSQLLRSPLEGMRVLSEIQVSPDALQPLRKKRPLDQHWMGRPRSTAAQSEVDVEGSDTESDGGQGTMNKVMRPQWEQLPLNLSTKVYPTATVTSLPSDTPALLPLRKCPSTSSMTGVCFAMSPFTSSNSEASLKSDDMERPTSDTLRLLVGSITESDNGRSLKLGKSEDGQPKLVQVGLAYNCPHIEAATLPAVSLLEHASDEARLATLKVQLTNLMVTLLGEARITQMGYPDTDILAVLKTVLSDAPSRVASISDDCTESCQCFGDSLQLRFRKLKRKLLTTRRNIQSFLEICVNQDIWSQWKNKPVEDVLQDIMQRGVGHLDHHALVYSGSGNFSHGRHHDHL
eukprot:maker-scaffold346_size200932-snap-gene-1.19 protein:Tk04305 transcript:maker-scaffold346_size200932-snap-gene-1.19-mRNA-1 annotation:"sporulation protein"